MDEVTGSLQRVSDLPPVVVMGVTGCGKSVVGSAIAGRLHATFLEGDRFHPPENIGLMSRGTPLNDANRAGWLDLIGAELARTANAGRRVVAGCSALKRAYRDRLRARNPDLLFVFLEIDRETAYSRVAARKGHFMPASLVTSQFADLEPPGADENAITLDARRSVAELVASAAGFIERKRGGD
jgi:gluconokinase